MLSDDQRPFHACFPVTGNRAVEDVLSWLAHFHVHNASTSLGESEVNVGLAFRLDVRVFASSAEVGDVDIGINLINREVVQERLYVLNGDFDDIPGVHLQHIRREREARHLDKE